MAKNIYELFNERVNGIDYLVEGYDSDFDLETESFEGEAYEDLDVAAEALTEITENYNNEVMEFQAACYLEELIIESMIYDDFDEERIGTVIEGTIKEKLGGFAARLKEYWDKLVSWVKAAFQTVVNLFKSGEAIIKQYGRAEVATAIGKCERKIKLPQYENPSKAMNKVKQVMGISIKMEGLDDKNAVLNKFGIKKAKEIDEKVHKIFVKGDKSEVTISSLKAGDIVAAIEKRSELVGMLNDYKKTLDTEFSNAINQCKREGKGSKGLEKDTMSRKVEAFNMAQTIKNKACSAALHEYRVMHKNYVQIVKAAVSPLGAKMGEVKAAKAAKKAEKEKAAEEVKESFKYDEIEFL